MSVIVVIYLHVDESKLIQFPPPMDRYCPALIRNYVSMTEAETSHSGIVVHQRRDRAMKYAGKINRSNVYRSQIKPACIHLRAIYPA